MATPDYVRALREEVGHGLLFLPGVTAVVHDDAGRVLLGRRADTGRWALVAGIAEPGEQPADTAVREVREETAVHCVPERVVLVETKKPVEYPNGDRCQFLDITLSCRAVGGVARVNDDESLEVGWFAPDRLPTVGAGTRHRLALTWGHGPTWFAPATDGGEAARS